MRKTSRNERKAHLLETINTFGSKLMLAKSVQECAWVVTRDAVAKLGYIDCIIFLINDYRELFQCAAHGNKNPTAQDILNPIKLKMGEGVSGHVALTGIAEIIGDTSKDPRYIVDDENRYSEIAVPVISGGVVIGVIDSEHPEKGYFSEYDLNILTTIASMLSLKISQTQALDEKYEGAEELGMANSELTFQNEEKEKQADELAIAKKELVSQGEENDDLIDKLKIVRKEKLSRVEALEIAEEKIVEQGEEKADLIDELNIVKKEKLSRVEALKIAKGKIIEQGVEKADLIDELTSVKKEKLSRVEALEIAEEKIVEQGEEKADLIDELAIANMELTFQNEEKTDLIDELAIANKELTFQNEEKANRANELEFKIKFRTKELEESLEREKELGILKTNFVSMASHEFRTPLTSIKVTSDVILKYFDKLSRSGINERLEKIKREVADMTIMLEDILIIGKSESQKLKFSPHLLDIVGLIKGIITEYQLRESVNRQIVYDISTPLIEVNADKKWLKHIVLNLFSNAIKYSDKNELIEISIIQNLSEVSFCFKDCGIGIPKEDIKRLFEPFYRGENVQNISGTGLGLSVLKKAIELHKGKIEVESEIGKGSSFKVILPLDKENHNEKK
jgi:signal transduction histidine kinase